LGKLIEANDAALVGACTKQAHDILQKAYSMETVVQAVQTLTTLKGVGPATATLILSTCDDRVPFFSDHVASLVLKEPLKYTLKQAREYMRIMLTTFEEEAGRVERLLWMHSVLEHHGKEHGMNVDAYMERLAPRHKKRKR
jgi:endonuclease III-like uncharacterized protein